MKQLMMGRNINAQYQTLYHLSSCNTLHYSTESNLTLARVYLIFNTWTVMANQKYLFSYSGYNL